MSRPSNDTVKSEQMGKKRKLDEISNTPVEERRISESKKVQNPSNNTSYFDAKSKNSGED